MTELAAHLEAGKLLCCKTLSALILKIMIVNKKKYKYTVILL